jgi:hypothetical protein
VPTNTRYMTHSTYSLNLIFEVGLANKDPELLTLKHSIACLWLLFTACPHSTWLKGSLASKVEA